MAVAVVVDTVACVSLFGAGSGSGELVNLASRLRFTVSLIRAWKAAASLGARSPRLSSLLIACKMIVRRDFRRNWIVAYLVQLLYRIHVNLLASRGRSLSYIR